MKRPFDEELSDSFKKLNQQFRLKPEHQEGLKARVLLQSQKAMPVRRSYKKVMIAIAAALLLLTGFSPMYSTTMATLAAKYLPFEIRAVENSPNSEQYALDMAELVEQTGYQIASLGTLSSPYTIEVGVLENGDSLALVKEKLQPKIEQYLADNGVDQYDLVISIEKSHEEPIESEIDVTMQKLNPIIQEAVKNHGHPEIARSISFGMDNEKTLSFELPDLVTNIEEIRTAIVEAIALENLDVKKVEITTFNEKAQDKEELWRSIGMDIYNALAGKSIYDATGYSYGMKDGVAFIEIKTNLPQSTSKQILTDMEAGIHDYLASDAIQPNIQSDKYEIKIFADNNKILLEVSKTQGE